VSGLPLAKGDATLGEIVRREFNPDLVAGNNPDEVLSHLTGNVGIDDVPTINLNPKPGVCQGLGNDALDLECLFFFRHGGPVENGDANGSNCILPAGIRPLHCLERGRNGLSLGRGGDRIRGLPAEIGIQEAVEVAIEHTLEITDVVAGSLILDPLVRVEEVVADL